MGIQLNSPYAKCCLVVTKAVDDLVTGNTTFKIKHPGTLTALLSPENLAQVEMKQTETPGGQKTIVQVQYFTNPRTGATIGWPDFCGTGETEPQKFATFDPLSPVSVVQDLTEAQFKEFCLADGDTAENITVTSYAQQLIRAKLNQLFKGVNDSLLVELATRVGNFADGTAGPQLVPLVDVKGRPNEQGVTDMEIAFEDIEITNIDDLLVIGSGFLNRHFKGLKYACCSDAGVNIGQTGAPFNFFREPNIDTLVAGEQNIIAFAPGAAVPFFVSEFKGKYSTADWSHTNILKDTIEVPFEFNGVSYNIPVDYTAKYHECGHADNGTNTPNSSWRLTFTITPGLVSLPTDIEISGSPFLGVNNILHFRGECGEPDFCSPAE
jgi:hypothetical protein